MPYELYLNGSWRAAIEGGEIAIRNPATGELVAHAAHGGPRDAILAMDAAAAAFPAWKAVPAGERAALLERAATLIRERAQAIARVVTEETGKPLAESVGEVVGCSDWFEWYAEEAKRAYGRTVTSPDRNKRLWVQRQPVGVVVAVTAWNFPVSLMCRKLAPALAVGCPVVCRPDDRAPLAAMLVFECLHDAGFPPGSVGLVTGPPAPTVQALMEHPACRKLAFTGSTRVGKELMARAAGSLLKLSLELGGHAPLIVFPDVDLDRAAAQAVAGKFRNAGQTCIAPSRFYVHRSIFDRFRDAVVAHVKRIVVGNGLDPRVTMGPLFGDTQLTRTQGFLADAQAHGAKVLTGGQRLSGPSHDRGFFFAPTVLEGAVAPARLLHEEYFGPLLPLLPFDGEAEVIDAANDTPYGLAAYVLVRDLGTAIRVSEALDVGIVGINDTVPTTPHAPFGGWKQSGVGREGGSEGLDAYLETKFISVGI